MNFKVICWFSSCLPNTFTIGYSTRYQLVIFHLSLSLIIYLFVQSPVFVGYLPAANNESSEVSGIIKPGRKVKLIRSQAVNVHKLLTICYFPPGANRPTYSCDVTCIHSNICICSLIRSTDIKSKPETLFKLLNYGVYIAWVFSSYL